jgi:adenosylcobinamide-GDP ribazoletransferase
VTPLWLALGFLTRWPVPRVAANAGDVAASVRWYPIAGLAVGVPVALAGWAGARIDLWTGALAALVAWVLMTGALHLDGLGDLADGLGAAHGKRDRLLAVMADPHLGSFGAAAIVLQLLAKLVLLHLVVGDWAVAPVAAVARTGPLVWARFLPPLKPGYGAGIAGAVRARDLVGWAAMLAGICVAVPALVVTPLLVIGWLAYLRARTGGVTGDMHGAGIELVETGLLLALAIASHR